MSRLAQVITLLFADHFCFQLNVHKCISTFTNVLLSSNINNNCLYLKEKAVRGCIHHDLSRSHNTVELIPF